ILSGDCSTHICVYDLLTYQWQSNGTDIVGATGATYTVLEGDEGKAIQVVVTSHDTDGTGTSTTSNATSAVTDISPALTAATIARSEERRARNSITGRK